VSYNRIHKPEQNGIGTLGLDGGLS